MVEFSPKNPKFYLKKLKISKGLFKKVWEDFCHESPNCECDEDILDYLDARCVDYVNDEESEFYLRG